MPNRDQYRPRLWGASSLSYAICLRKVNIVRIFLRYSWHPYGVIESKQYEGKEGGKDPPLVGTWLVPALKCLDHCGGRRQVVWDISRLLSITPSIAVGVFAP